MMMMVGRGFGEIRRVELRLKGKRSHPMSIKVTRKEMVT